MQSKAGSVSAYLDELPEVRKKTVAELRKVIVKNLPKGFQEVMNYGMIGYVVPHALYPAGYHCDPKQPLPFMGLASQKNHISFYHMGLYSDELLLAWFKKKWASETDSKLDIGRSCIRFKKQEGIPFNLLGELVSKMTPRDWIAHYETRIKTR
jgi:hypothetical protein